MSTIVMYGNGAYCNHSIENELKPLLIIFSSSGSVCAAMCFIAVLVILLCRFYKRLTHRLILYMLISILFFSLTVSVQFLGLWFKYWEGKLLDVCIAESFVLEYGVWVMLLSTLIMTFHLTSMVLLPRHYENIAKLEPFYFLFPWVFPLFIAWIPFIHHNYGISGSWCWIRLYTDNCTLNKEGMIEIYAVWYGELSIGLILNNIGLLVIGITLCKRACCQSTKDELISNHYRKALKQTLPLITYPITYQLLSTFAIANRLYQALHKGDSVQWMFYAHAVTAPIWGFFAPIFTFVYLAGILKYTKNGLKRFSTRLFSKKIKKLVINNRDGASVIARLLDPADHLTGYKTLPTDSCPTGAEPFRSETEVDYEYERTLSLHS